ncbi:MAG: class I SAM-dependent methyltransferase [Flavobacteriaceae bacterium]|nr:class I SAM-dependent methyltransferase [Flavobacteriaceae bacterium]
MKDLFGKAILDYQTGNYTEDMITATHISDNEVLPLPYLFRSYDDMPELEQQALDMCSGHVLDLGCGAGSHSLYLEERGFDVTSIDISEAAIKACKLRGLHKARQIDILNLKDRFDTIISLMNGTGLFQTMQKATVYLKHLKTLLRPGGQILIDSSDVSYMYDTEDLEWIKQNGMPYYGELEYYLSYCGESEDAMTWLYLDFKSLNDLSSGCGLNCEMVMAGDHYDYLARISIK